MGSGFSKRKKEAKQLQDRLAKMQEEMQQVEVVGVSGNGLVQITLSGEKQVKKVSIRPECVDPEEVEGLEDLILAAFNDAMDKVESQSPSLDLGGVGGLTLPSASGGRSPLNFPW